EAERASGAASLRESEALINRLSATNHTLEVETNALRKEIAEAQEALAQRLHRLQNIFIRTYPFKAHIDIANAYDGVERLLDDIDLILRSRKATARHLISLNAAALRANAAALRQRVRSPAQRVLSRVRSEEILRPKLWHYKQYASRKVHVPKAYARY